MRCGAREAFASSPVAPFVMLALGSSCGGRTGEFGLAEPDFAARYARAVCGGVNIGDCWIAFD